MPLQASGEISISQISTELLRRGTNSYSLRTLSSAASKSSPDAMSEFYSFNGCIPYGTFYGQTCSGYGLYNLFYDGTCNANGTSFGLYNVGVNGCSPTCGAPSGCTAAGTIIYQECTCYMEYFLGEGDGIWGQYPDGFAKKIADGCCGYYYEIIQPYNSSCDAFCCSIGVNCP